MTAQQQKFSKGNDGESIKGIRSIAVESCVISIWQVFLILLLIIITSESVFAETITITANGNNQFIVDGHIGRFPVQFLVDTGATATTVPRSILNAADPNGTCEYRKVVTANGTIDICRRLVKSMRIGNIDSINVPVYIGFDDSKYGLLGMNYLMGFRVVIDNGVMTLTRK